MTQLTIELEDFKRWLDGRCVAGASGSAEFCPVAAYLRAKNPSGTLISVCPRVAYLGHNDGAMQRWREYDLPGWAVRLIEAMDEAAFQRDRRYGGFVSGEFVLRFLP